jgi:hypothetical protein
MGMAGSGLSAPSSRTRGFAPQCSEHGVANQYPGYAYRYQGRIFRHPHKRRQPETGGRTSGYGVRLPY